MLAMFDLLCEFDGSKSGSNILLLRSYIKQSYKEQTIRREVGVEKPRVFYQINYLLTLCKSWKFSYFSFHKKKIFNFNMITKQVSKKPKICKNPLSDAPERKLQITSYYQQQQQHIMGRSYNFL